MIQDSGTQPFVRLGLTEIEAKIYPTLLDIGSANAEELFKQTGTPQLDVHRALEALPKIGLVEEETTNTLFLSPSKNLSKRRHMRG